MNYSMQGIIATGYLESQPGCLAAFRKKAVLGFARFRCATLWLKRHLVAEEHVGFSKVRNWLPSSLPRIQIRETEPTFLVSEFLDVKLFSQAHRRLLAESFFLCGTAKPGNWPILLTHSPKNVTRGRDSHPGELFSRAQAKGATRMKRWRPAEVATCSGRAGFGIPELIFV